MAREELAIKGGIPVRSRPFPPRRLFGEEELAIVQEVFERSWDTNVDFMYQGEYENSYCRQFCEFHGGGFADVVCTGTAALFVALAALELPKGSHVIVSPITDPGTINAIIFNGLVPVLADSMPNSFNMGFEQFAERITEKTKAVMVVHATGKAAPVDRIAELAYEKGIKVIEDCSQSHGATIDGKRIGNFGTIAAFSTMSRKGHATGASGGVVFCHDENLYRLARAYADRGKPFWRDDFEETNPTTFLFPALNFHTNELSCAIGIKTLERLPSTIANRLRYIKMIKEGLDVQKGVCAPYKIDETDAPFVYPIFVDSKHITCSKTDFAKAVRAEGIPLNPHYNYVICEWPWVQSYLYDDFVCRNALDCRNRSFNLFINEHYGQSEAEDTIDAIQKVGDILKRDE